MFFDLHENKNKLLTDFIPDIYNDNPTIIIPSLVSNTTKCITLNSRKFQKQFKSCQDMKDDQRIKIVKVNIKKCSHCNPHLQNVCFLVTKCLTLHLTNVLLLPYWVCI